MGLKEDFKYLKEHKKLRRAENKSMKQLTDDELISIAFDEEDFLPNPYDKPSEKKKSGPKARRVLWMAQQGLTFGKIKVSLSVIKYALVKLGVSCQNIETIIRKQLRPKFKGPGGYYNLKSDFFMPFIDNKDIFKFGDRIVMSKNLSKIFKEEYEQKYRQEKEKSKKI